jgi:hypothetical protein
VWAIKERKLLGFALFAGGMPAGAGVSYLAPYLGVDQFAFGTLAAGVLMIGGDLLMRHFGGEGAGIKRYLGSFRGPTLRGTQVWIVGLIIAVAGVIAVVKG